MKAAVRTPNGIYYWVDLSHQFAKKSLDILKREYPPAMRNRLKMKITTSPTIDIVFPNGARVSFRTAQNPDSLVGETLDGLVINEAGLIINPDVFSQMLLPALGVKQGWAVFVSSPRTRNWYADIFDEGKSGCTHWSDTWGVRDHTCICTGEDHLYHSFWNPTNPDTSSMTAGEILMARHSRGMTQRKFAMEYLGEFAIEDSSVFRNFRLCVSGGLEEPREGASYVIGVDLGKQRDYTVITVIDRQTNHVVHFDRFNNLPWSVIEERIIAAHHRYGRGKVVVDGTGVGDVVCANLRRTIRNMEVFVIGNNIKKVELVENLISLMEHEDLSFPDIPELTQELSEFGFRETLSGNVKYEGRMDAHDDCVISLALACYPLRRRAVKQLTAREARLVKRAWKL